MWGGITKINIDKQKFNRIFFTYRRGHLHRIREKIIAAESPSSFPRPWSFFRYIEGIGDNKRHKLRNFDCALLLKWTRDILNHQIHREEKLQSLQLGIEMFDGMMSRHTVGELAFCQFFALCESAADFKTAIERFRSVLEKYEIDFETKQNGGKSEVATSSRNSSSGVPDFSFLQSPNSYAWLLRIAYSNFAHHQTFDTVLSEESIASIVQIVIPHKILQEMEREIAMMNQQEQNNPSSSVSNKSNNSNNSPISRLKKLSRRNSSSSSGRNSQQHQLAALIAPHDSTTITPSSSSHQTISFSIAALLHLLRPYFRTDIKLQKLVDDYINPALIAQDEYEMKTNSSIPISLATNHISFLKKSLMSHLALDSSSSSSTSNNNATKYLLRKITLYERDFLYSSSEVTDGPRGSSKLLIVGGGDNWENDSPEFDRNEIIGFFMQNQQETASRLMTSQQSSNSFSSSSFSENHYSITLSPVQYANISRRPHTYNWSFTHPYPLANSIAPAGRLLDIFETLFSVFKKNHDNNSTNNLADSLHKLALMINYIPKHFTHRLEIQSLRSEVPTAASDSHYMLMGGCCSDSEEERESEKLVGTLINDTLKNSNSTPELLHYLLCAIARTSPGSAVEAVCKMLLSSSSSSNNINNNDNPLLLLLPLDPTLASIVCGLLLVTNNENNTTTTNDEMTIELAASFMAHSSLVRSKRLEAYRDAEVNGECPQQLKSVWRKRYFDHIFETNCMSEVQFLTFVGNEVGPELLTKVFRVSQEMVEKTKQRMADERDSAAMMKLEKKRWVEEEKEKFLEEQSKKGVVAPILPDWLVNDQL